MNVNRANNHHLRVAHSIQSTVGTIRPSLCHSTHDTHSSKSKQVSTPLLGRSAVRQSTVKTTPEAVNQSNNTASADKYISAVRNRLTQASSKAAHRFNRDLNKVLSQHKGPIDDASKTNAVDTVLNKMAARGDIGQDMFAELKALNPAATKQGDGGLTGQSTSGTTIDPIQAGSVTMPTNDVATDFASNGENSRSDKAIKTAQPAAPHSSGNGASSGPEMPNPTFLWKPSSDSDGNLVILLPAGMTGQVADLEVLSPDGKTVLAKGKYTGAGNGMREHYRFGKPGASFPPGSIVKVTMSNGTQKEIKIPNPGSRMESK